MLWRGKFGFSNWTLVAVLVFICGVWTCSGHTVRRIRNNKHHTKIACEGETLNITCPYGYVINIVRANYGRFSLLECNEKSETWSDVQCMYPKSTRVMEERCGNRSECAVEAVNDAFGDSCPDVGKYLEVQYFCVLYSSYNTSTIFYTYTESPRVTTTTPTPTPDSASTSSKRNAPTSSTMQAVTIRQIVTKPSFCPETESRGLKWPSTRVNNPARLPCPNNADAYAEWWCSAEGEWILDSPDLSRCVSLWAKQLDIQSKSIDNEEAAKTLARNLQSDTRANRLYGGDTSTSVDVMQQLTITAESLTQTAESDSRKMTFLMELNKYLVETGSNLLQEEGRSAWMDLPPSNQSATADRLVLAVENMAVTTAKRLDGPTSSVQLVSPKITVEVSGVQIQEYVQFPARSLYDNRLDNIQLPRAALEKSGHQSGEWSKVVFVSYDSLLGEYMRPEASIVSDENGVETIVERRIVSKLISASIVKLKRDDDVDKQSRPDVAEVDRLPQPVFMTFALKKNDENMSNAACVYWRSVDRKWSTDGCSIRRQNDTHVSCSCDHLTTFAVLMDVRGLRLDPANQLALAFITCVGCIISICCCAVAILAFCLFSGTHYTDRITIHKNLCFCLLVAESIFLFGIAQTQHRIACGVVAGLLHYFFLAAFAWMLLEGFQLYSLLIEVFEAERSRKPYFYLFGYGMPAVIVGISVLVDHTSYGTRRHCWLNTDNYFVFSFVGPVVVVLTANVIFLIMALVVMCRHATFSSGHRHDPNRTTIDNVAVWLRGATILVILLGLTWAVGLLYVNEATLAMAYAFTILNSLQGFFIFVFHVLLNDKMRKEWNKWLTRRRGRAPSWMRSPAASADYKPSKAQMDEPMPMLVGVLRTTESESLPTPNATSTGTECHSLLTKLFGGQRQRNSARGSVGQLLLIRSGSANSGKTCKYDYPYASHSSSSDAATNSELTVESPCPRYSISPRPPPNFPPPSPPKQPPMYCSRHAPSTATMPTFRAPNHDRQLGAPHDFSTFDRAFVDEHRNDGEGDRGNPYASTDAYFLAESDRPDSGYSGSAHRPTPPPPAPCCSETDAVQGWPTGYVRRVPQTNFCRHQQQQKRIYQKSGVGCRDCAPNTDLNYEVPVHAATTTSASVSPSSYGVHD